MHIRYYTSMIETNIITGKITIMLPNSEQERSLYLKVNTGQFTKKAPTPKKAKVLVGELLVRYSSRQWPKKFGPLAGNAAVLEGLSQLLKEVNLHYTKDISYSQEQHDIKETLTIKVGKLLAQEIVDRGWASIE